ncbi:hypothetical protein [Nitrospira sp. Nam80]
MPFWDAGAGMIWTDLAPRIPEQSTPFEFVSETGALTTGFRFHHISNGNLGRGTPASTPGSLSLECRSFFRSESR